jgi:hypothetical protein
MEILSPIITMSPDPPLSSDKMHGGRTPSKRVSLTKQITAWTGIANSINTKDLNIMHKPRPSNPSHLSQVSNSIRLLQFSGCVRGVFQPNVKEFGHPVEH